MWYKELHYWRKPSPEWEVKRYGKPVNSKGDLIFNTCYKIFRDKDKSVWAYHAMVDCATLLMRRKRWPDYMNQDIDAKSKFGRWISKMLYSLKLRDTVKYRPQGKLTRDPFIALFLVCVFLDRKQFIEVVKMPLRIYSHATWKWRRRLISKDKRHVVRRRLRWLRANAVVLNNPEFN